MHNVVWSCAEILPYFPIIEFDLASPLMLFQVAVNSEHVYNRWSWSINKYCILIAEDISL